jgi:hypothetical protein
LKNKIHGDGSGFLALRQMLFGTVKDRGNTCKFYCNHFFDEDFKLCNDTKF